MNPEKVIKTEEYREYTVKQHQRKIFLRKYKFVCGGCDRTVTRESFALCCPNYGNECNGQQSKCRREKKH